MEKNYGGVAELADAQGLSPCSVRAEWEFDPPLPYQKTLDIS